MIADFLPPPSRRNTARLAVALGAWFFLAGCTHDFALHRRDPLRAETGRFPPQGLVAAGICAQKNGEADRAAGLYLDALEIIDSNDDDNEMAARNFITARLIEICAPRLLSQPASPLTLAGQGGRRYLVTLRRGKGRGGVEPRAFASLQPTDRYAVTHMPGGNGLRPGTGATLVGQLPPIAPPQKTERPAKPIAGLRWSVTAVAALGPMQKNGRLVALELYEPHDAETVAASRARNEPLAADFTTPLAVSQAFTSRRGFAVGGFLRGDEYFGNAGIYPSEVPTPDKTPVVLVHGLISDPRVCCYLAHAIETDPDLHRRYQIWYFYYPTGLPVVVSAALLRDDLKKEVARLDPERRHPALHHAVLVGHSMGGLVARLNVSDSGGDKFYRFYFRKPFEQLDLSPEHREKVRDAMFFRVSPDVRSVVFIATPHRGSELAHSFLGSLGRGLVSIPHAMSRSLREIVADNPDAFAKADLRDESSIFNLRPESTLVRALAVLPIRVHSIFSVLGNRGRPGPLAESSDGIVAYRSAHLPQAARETVVPAGHTGTLKASGTIAEVERILREDTKRNRSSGHEDLILPR